MKGEGSLTRARITYFFKETFRAHSKYEYKEFLTRGLGDDRQGITGTHPWLYVRIFFILFILFTVNTLILRFTGNTLYIPTVTLLAGITITVPFMVLLYELYQKRDLNSIKLFGIIVIGGTVAALLTQILYSVVKVDSVWLYALVSASIEEGSKALIAIAAILVMRNKNAYVCFLVAAAVGAGFSIIEDMGYIFNYSDLVAAQYGDIRNTVFMFLDRGLSSFCTHVLWTGFIGWAYGASKTKFKGWCLPALIFSTLLHTMWNLPLEGWMHFGAILICSAITIISNIVAVRKSLFATLSDEFDIARMNDDIIKQAKEMGERMRFTNAANLTFSLTCTFLSVLAIALCCLPIGMEKVRVQYPNKEDFIAAIQGDYNVKIDWNRQYVPGGACAEWDNFYDNNGNLTHSYVVQMTELDGYEGIYYYGYYLDDKGVAAKKADSIYLELDDFASRIFCVEYKFGDEKVWVFEVHADQYSDYTYNSSDGTVSCVIDAEDFKGYDLLIALIAGAIAVTGACGIILCAFTIKLKRVKGE